MGKGKVWLVGAGPGDGGLLTRKGENVLKQADVVVYDSLLGYEILNLIPEHAEKILVGKRASHHTMPQEQINEVLLDEAKRGKQVVRLKGGDPFLFGRGGEELELLEEQNIPYEIVPGVTSALAVAAYQGIPVTHRDYASSVHIITGHRREGKQLAIDFEALVRTKGTLVFLMGVASLQEICTGLLEAGMEPDMSAALLSKGTTCEQKRLVATVCTLPKEQHKHPLETPAILVVGRVCELADQFFWYEKRPLAGRRILVTRPQERQSELAERLRELGAEVLSVPAVQLETILTSKQLRQSKKQWEDAAVIAFTSPSGVERFFDLLTEAEMDIRSLGTMKVAAIGSATKKALKKRGILTDLMPETYDAGALGRCIADACEKGTKVFLPRAANGSLDLVEELQKKELQIVELSVYRTRPQIKNSILNLTELCRQGKIQWVTFTSASTVHGFAQQTADLDYGHVNALCIGEKTAEAARTYGMHVTVAKQATIDAMIETLIDVEGGNEQ
ncbi:MAG: uroporphyrinogen-III C-methyltransferase [Lachnospiraceae bacterium]